jgi:dimethylargininase
MMTRALMRRPASTIAGGLTSQTTLGAPGVDATLRQYDAYADALRVCGLDLTILAADERFPDGHFVEDTAVIFQEVAFLSRPGADARAEEVSSIAEALRGLESVFPQNEESRMDGGDVLFCVDRVLIGLSGRTNRAGAEELRAGLRAVQADLRVDVVAFSGVLHLTSGITELAPGILLKDPAMQTDYAFDALRVITLPPEEGYAANVLPINDAVIIPKGFPTVTSLAVEHVENVIAVETSEFRKMDGALTCLSLRY